MISTGLGELNGYFLLQSCRVPSKVAVATSAFVVTAMALTASIGYAVQFHRETTARSLPETGADLASQPTISRMENAVNARSCYRMAKELLELYL